jgi:hypothetical protein
MRTSLDLPDELMRRAKIAAVERGTSLRDLIGQALTRELDSPANPPTARRRGSFPVFRSASPGNLALTNAEIGRLELEKDGNDFID